MRKHADRLQLTLRFRHLVRRLPHEMKNHRRRTRHRRLETDIENNRSDRQRRAKPEQKC